MSDFLQDLRGAARMLRKQPGFTLVAVLSLALGLGANTTIFTLVNAVFLKPLPVHEPEELVTIFTRNEQASAGGSMSYFPVSLPEYEDYTRQAELFSGVMAYRWARLSLASGGDPEQFWGQVVSGNYFDVLGVEPAVGRTFLPEEGAAAGGPPVVVLSHGLWERRFGSDPGIAGKTVTLNRQPFTVVGVAARGFQGASKLGSAEMWIPVSVHDQVLPPTPGLRLRSGRFFFTIGRLKPGVSPEQAGSAMRLLARQLEQAYPAEHKGWTIQLLPLSQAMANPQMEDTIKRARTLLLGAALLVLFIAGINVANLLLARSLDRKAEMSIRLSLGARRGRLIRQLLTESTLLSLLGGAVGLLLAFWGGSLLWSFRPPWMQQSFLRPDLDVRVLASTLLLSLATGILFGLVPALQLSRPDLASVLKDRSSRSGQGGPGAGRLRNLFVVAQIALCLVSLVGAGLFLRSLRNAQRIDPGFDTRHLLLVSLDLGTEGYDETRARAFQDRLLERTRTVPGVEAVSLAENRPLFFGGMLRGIYLEGRESSQGAAGDEGILIRTNNVEPGYFGTASIPLLQGRVFQESDRVGSPLVAMINRVMAERFWPGQSPLGKRFRFDEQSDPLEVVGVVESSKYVTLGEDPQPYIYLPMAQRYSPAVTLFVRAAEGQDPAALLPAVRREILDLDAGLPLAEVNTVRDLIASGLWLPRVGALLLIFFGSLGLILATLGVYGVMSYAVNRRRGELGIRMALGAQPGNLRKLVLGESFRLVLAGLGLGLVAAFASTRLMAGLLYGISASDPASMVVVAILLAAIAMLASYLPARRAARTDPATVLRAE